MQQQENEINALKRKVQESKVDIKKIKQDAAERQKSLKASYESMMKDLKNQRNTLSNQVRRLEVRQRDKQPKTSGKSESIEQYAQKLELKQMAEESQCEAESKNYIKIQPNQPTKTIERIIFYSIRKYSIITLEAESKRSRRRGRRIEENCTAAT